MTYITKGEYSSTDDGYLIGYKLIRSNFESFRTSKFKYTQGRVAGHRPDEFRKGLFSFLSYYPGDEIHHCCSQKELQTHWANQYLTSHDSARLVRLLIHPNDMIKRGVCYRAYVDMISPVMFQWGVFSPEGSLAPDLPPVTELEKKKLNAGLSVDEVISVVMAPAPELEKVEKTRSLATINYPHDYGTYIIGSGTEFPSNPYYFTREKQ